MRYVLCAIGSVLLTGVLNVGCVNTSIQQPELREEQTTPELRATWDSIYKIVVQELATSGVARQGSGVCVDCEPCDLGYRVTLLTAKHVVSLASERPTEMKLVLMGMATEISSHQLIGTDRPGWVVDIVQAAHHPDVDLAIVRAIVPFPLPKAEISPHGPSTGQEIDAFGFPLNLGLTITNGEIGHYSSQYKAIACSAQVYGGSSGGGVFDRDTKKLLGISISYQRHRYTSRWGTSYDDGVNFVHYFISLEMFKDWLIKEGIKWPKAG